MTKPKVHPSEHFTSKTARERIKVGNTIHWLVVARGEPALGYKRERGKPGQWFVRRYVGFQKDADGNRTGNPYEVRVLGTADDAPFEPDGDKVLTFKQAIKKLQDTTKPRTFDDDPDAVVTVAHALRDYFEWRGGKGSDTKIDRARAALYILPYLGDTRISDLRSKALRKWRDKIAALPAKYRGGDERESDERKRKATANKVLTILKAALTHAWEEEDDDAGPLAKAKTAWDKLKPFKGVDKPRVQYIEHEADVNRLINAADDKSGFRNLVQAAFLTGIRYGGLTKLRVRDFANGTLRVKSDKRGEEDQEFIVELNAHARKFFDQLVRGRPKDELIFLRHYVEKRRGQPDALRYVPWKKSDQKRKWDTARDAARIPPDEDGKPISFNATRHTWATHALKEGLPKEYVARNLGHKNTVMVEKHYGHFIKTHVRKLIEERTPTFGKIKPSNVVAFKAA